ncbi:hypothetical protein Tco_1300833 [Tanacetum coccineum]
MKLNTPIQRTQCAVFNIWKEYNILKDIKHGPYFKKSLIRRIQLHGYARKADKKMQAKPEKTSTNSGCLDKDRKMALEHDIEDLTKAACT